MMEVSNPWVSPQAGETKLALSSDLGRSCSRWQVCFFFFKTPSPNSLNLSAGVSQHSGTVTKLHSDAGPVDLVGAKVGF